MSRGTPRPHLPTQKCLIQVQRHDSLPLCCVYNILPLLYFLLFFWGSAFFCYIIHLSGKWDELILFYFSRQKNVLILTRMVSSEEQFVCVMVVFFHFVMKNIIIITGSVSVCQSNRMPKIIFPSQYLWSILTCLKHLIKYNFVFQFLIHQVDFCPFIYRIRSNGLLLSHCLLMEEEERG